MRYYAALPDIPEAGVLWRYAETLAVIVPVARTNLVTNPSFETSLDNWTAASWGSAQRNTTDQRFGVYALVLAIPSTTAPTLSYGTTTPIATTTGTTYAISLYVKPSHPCKVTGAVRNTADTASLGERTFTLHPGVWQRVAFLVRETSSTNRIVKWTFTLTGITLTLFTASVDGAQVEACTATTLFETTYIDGDQRGLVPNQSPPAYLWAGTPHASTSSRSAQTRAGGRVMRLKDFGFLLTAIIGLGLSPVTIDALTFAQLDGGQYRDTVKPPRTFSLAGRFGASAPGPLDMGLGQLARTLDRDRVGLRQPLVLTLRAQEDDMPVGDEVTVPAVYAGGLEGQAQELPTKAAALTFTQYAPVVFGRDDGQALIVQQSVSNANGIASRSAAGVWSALGTGVSGAGADVYAIARGPDGTIYAGGDFTDAGGSGADYFAAYNPTAGTWSVVGSATAITGPVRAIAIGPDGRVYVGGTFTNAAGIANADNIAVWNGASWAALSTGANGTVAALLFTPDGTLYAGGGFTDAGGSGADSIAQWNGSAWAVVGSATALNGAVDSLAYGNGVLYVGGDFTDAGGVGDADRIATWNGSAWGALGTGLGAPALALAVGPNGLVYAGGSFTTAGGVSASRVAVWNGSAWAPMGSGADNTVRKLAVAQDGTIYAGGAFTTMGGLAFTDRIARWNGSAWVLVDADLPGSPIVYAIVPAPDGALYVGFDTSGAATSGAVTTVTNAGTAQAFPRLVITGPSSGTARIYQFTNVTTGQTIYFNLTISAGETATLTLDPTNVTFTSTFQGNILSTILPGSNLAGFALQPGANDIAFFSGASTVTAVLSWQAAYLSIEDALYQVGE